MQVVQPSDAEEFYGKHRQEFLLEDDDCPLEILTDLRPNSGMHCISGVNWALVDVLLYAFSALTLLVRRQEGYPTCKKTEWWDAGMVCVWVKVQI